MLSDSPARRVVRGLRRVLRRLRYLAKRLSGRRVRVHIEARWRLGDEVMALPFYVLVREHWPTAEISVAVNYPGLAAGIAGLTVDNARDEFSCDRYLFACSDGRRVPRLQHLCRLHRVPYRRIEPSLDVARLPGLPDWPFEREPIVGYCCTAGWPCKSWSRTAMAGLLALVQQRRPDMAFVEVGRGGTKAGVGLDLADRLSVEQTATALSRCSFYVGPDSGLVHLALAVGTPAVGLYGPVVPERAFGPRAALTAALSPVECRGCHTDGRMEKPGTCPLGVESDDPEDYPCMRSLTPELVMGHIDRAGLLQKDDA